MNAVTIFVGLMLALVGFTCFVWLCKLTCEVVTALFNSGVFGVMLLWRVAVWLLRQAWWLVRFVLRLVCRMLLPLLGWLLEHVCVYTGLAWLYLSHRTKRAYIEREIKARRR